MLYIYTVSYNTPQYIEPQYKLLKKYIKNEFEYIVFNNTMTNHVITQNNINNNELIHNVCKNNAIKIVDLPKHIFYHIHENDASRRAGTAINFAHQYLFSNYSLESTFFLIDSDAFLLNDFDVEKFMENIKLSGRIQYRKGNNNTIKYITNQIVIFKPNQINLNNFSFLPCRIDGVNCDCGGEINFIFNKINDSDFINWKNNLFSKKGNDKQLYGVSPNEEDDFDEVFLDALDVNLKSFILNDTKKLQKNHPFCEIFTNNLNNVLFLHLRAGTNWIGYDFTHREKIFKDFINHCYN